ncbi:hypothetical protein [Aquabacterium sp.]|uniref:hypothetical protein n=1 Tax=Aquabacterium sp. TaxID=1872578 RepID=UPI003784C3BB
MVHLSTVRAAACALLVLLSSGCALQAPRYQPSIDNVEVIKRSQARPVMIGNFSVQAGAVGGSAIGLRGSSMASPVGSDYAAYLADALRQELALAGKLDSKSDIELSGLLTKNDIAAGGFSTNSGEIEARFIVKSGGQVRYDAVKRAELSWESSFVGAIAIPKAQQQYPVVVQQLLKALLEDAQFKSALR